MRHTMNANKVTFVHSGEKGGYLQIPLSILCLAESLMRSGFAPHLVDLRVRDLTKDDLKGALYLGVSHMTGSMQIPQALKCAKLAKSLDVPVVFGGAHPSVLPEQTAAHALVDIAAKGEGEDIVVELARYFRDGGDLASILGIAFKDVSGRIVFTGDRPPPEFDRIAHLPYHLLPMHEYAATNQDFGYQSSRGCPHRCAFCAEVALYPRMWRPKSAHVVFCEVKHILERYNPKRIFFMDSNFFVSKKRVIEFCNLVIQENIKVGFFAECRFDYFYRYDDDFISLLKRAGFTEIEFGGESGSDVTLEFIQKDITAAKILGGIRKCRDFKLKSFTSFMIGFPGETELEMLRTLEIYDEITTIDPKGARINGMFVYSPFPGTKLYDLVVNKWGFRPPTSLDQWAAYELYNSRNVTWLDEKLKSRLQTISTIVRYFFVFKTIRDWSLPEKIEGHGGIGNALMSFLFNGFFYPFAKLRWKFRFFDFGQEFGIWQKVFYAYMGRK